MLENKVYTAIGLMSGTSLDAVDAALIETDGERYVRPLGFVSLPYAPEIREKIRACYGEKDRTAAKVREAETIVAEEHVKAVKALLQETGKTAGDIDLIGFHGQTIYHAPADGITHQIGDGALLARETGIDVIYDFRSNDVRHGGEGAPLAPVYHWALAHNNVDAKDFPVVVLNIGGIGNVTWLGANPEDMSAFDTGPGNALMDDWTKLRTGRPYDEDGRLAQAGTPRDDLLKTWMDHAYFKRVPPKSLDRDQWNLAGLGALTRELNDLSTEDGAATFLKFSVEAMVDSANFMPETPKNWFVCGGGRNNKELMKNLARRLADEGLGQLHRAEDIGWNGDATEAECFAYLAVRSKRGLFLSLPTTTRAPHPLTGGVLAPK